MKEDLTIYDIKPLEFINYLRYYGEHFNKKLCEVACEAYGCECMDKEKLHKMLESHSIDLKKVKLYDAVVIAARAKLCYYGKGIPDEHNLATYIKTVLEKEGDLIFARFLADMAKMGVPIEWEDVI